MFDQIIQYITELTTNHIVYFFGLFYLLCVVSGLGFPISSDLLLISVSYLIYLGKVNYPLAVVIAILGILSGDVIMYFIGRKSSSFALLKIDPAAMERASKTINKYGALSIFMARFIPGFRTVIIFSGGMMKLPFLNFIVADLLGALIVIPCLLYSVVFFSGSTEVIKNFIMQIQGNSTFLLGGFLLLITFVFYKLRKSKKA